VVHGLLGPTFVSGFTVRCTTGLWIGVFLLHCIGKVVYSRCAVNLLANDGSTSMPSFDNISFRIIEL